MTLRLALLVYVQGFQNYAKMQNHIIDYFTVVCSVTWPINESEAEGELTTIETSQVLSCKFLLISYQGY